MYELVRSLSTRELFARQAPVLIGSLAIAEFFYKFGSFLLEAVAFLVTWFLLDVLTDFASRRGRFRVGSDR